MICARLDTCQFTDNNLKGVVPILTMACGWAKQIFPAHVKGVAGSVATLVNWSCSYAVTMIFNYMLLWSSAGKSSRLLVKFKKTPGLLRLLSL